ncbi:hypothetical protein DFH08DRAFT_941069 [Mycena albidolilacea]|uniref:Uncharacterized protein n=1 Tax=Mycena albidolilacea TaxID=1033008 RepID=A0AAD6ZK98_9AGAR|nr:hypothetical protein DFH08DRAFT_941069 [Mycena albidolilacea]
MSVYAEVSLAIALSSSTPIFITFHALRTYYSTHTSQEGKERSEEMKEIQETERGTGRVKTVCGPADVGRREERRERVVEKGEGAHRIHFCVCERCGVSYWVWVCLGLYASTMIVRLPVRVHRRPACVVRRAHASIGDVGFLPLPPHRETHLKQQNPHQPPTPPRNPKSQSSGRATCCAPEKNNQHLDPCIKPKLVPAQTLAFSTYGPSSRDNVLQGSYHSTEDGVYMQSLPNGEIVAFKTGSKEDLGVRWGRKFKSPIVAIFNVLRSPTQDTVFILLQPRPRLSAILPKLAQTTSMDQLQYLDSVYVGLVEAMGSLFAMSPDRFPLVAFSGAGRGRVKLETAGGEPKQRSYGSEDADGAEQCLDRSSQRCLVGMHPLEGGDEDGPQYRLKRLVDGVPGVVGGRPQMKQFCCCTETANEAVSWLHTTEDACPVVRIDEFAAKLDGQSSQPVVD